MLATFLCRIVQQQELTLVQRQPDTVEATLLFHQLRSAVVAPPVPPKRNALNTFCLAQLCIVLVCLLLLLSSHILPACSQLCRPTHTQWVCPIAALLCRQLASKDSTERCRCPLAVPSATALFR